MNDLSPSRPARTAAALALTALGVSFAYADEGGTSFWLPGNFGSFAALAGEAGWSLPLSYYHTSVDASRSKELPVGGRIRAGLNADADLLFLLPTYTLRTPVLGGQAAVSLIGLFGNMDVSANATLTGPRGATLNSNPHDSVTSLGDLYPMGTLKWNAGVSNFMTYTMLGVPVGKYDAGQLANIGTNHWSIDAGGGYTYFDAQAGREASGVLGFTYNFENPDTNYQNGVDAHFDWAASQFLNEQTHVGLVGYVYQQVSGDSGEGATLGDFKSRVIGVGPQLGHFLQLADRKIYVNLKGYYEFSASHRPDGWNTSLTLAIPLSSGTGQ